MIATDFPIKHLSDRADLANEPWGGGCEGKGEAILVREACAKGFSHADAFKVVLSITRSPFFDGSVVEMTGDVGALPVDFSFTTCALAPLGACARAENGEWQVRPAEAFYRFRIDVKGQQEYKEVRRCDNQQCSAKWINCTQLFHIKIARICVSSASVCGTGGGQGKLLQ